MVAWLARSLPILAASSFQNFRPTASGSPSPPSTTEISMSMSCLPMADSLNNNTVDAVVPHTDWVDTFPMWHGNTIYFNSDRGPEHHFNLYSYDLNSKQLEQVTHFNEFDVMWPSLGPDAIIFENAGYLYTFDFQSKQPKKRAVSVPGERAQSMKHWTSVSKNITDFDISPDGKRAVFSARGDVFTVPAKEGSIRNLTRTPGIREKLVTWSPDSKWISYISDRSGED